MSISGLIVTSLVAAAIIPTFITTLPALPMDIQTRLTAFFTNIDTDKSGNISFAEFQTHVNDLDKDNSTNVTEDEYNAGTPAGHKTRGKLFKYLDQDKNGYLDSQDLKVVFLHFDVDLDGQLSLQELMVQYTAIFTLIEAEVVMVTPKTVG